MIASTAAFSFTRQRRMSLMDARRVLNFSADWLRPAEKSMACAAVDGTAFAAPLRRPIDLAAPPDTLGGRLPQRLQLHLCGTWRRSCKQERGNPNACEHALR